MGKSIEKNKSVPEEPREELTDKRTFFLPFKCKVIEAETLEEVVELTKKEEDGDAN
ncbi:MULTISPECIES: hypothetical protein [Rhodococcus erythropolis group]|uniref:hypothetical protein n=1 Tax=Rhodococcus erythropolis group TaxID=2840174 RepID=UPI0017811AA8|nr:MULTISPECIES: hypothetical protein [Rhodococcus erythropolis group]MBW4816136.1 hypothetical protein [Rhodococcus qingshengii]